MQFQDVQSKLRINDMADGLGEMPDGIKCLPIRTDGLPTLFFTGPEDTSNLDVLAVGCQMPTLEEAQFALITAYMTYGKYHSERYKQEYGKDFTDFLLQVQAQLNNAIDYLKTTTEETL